MRIQVINPNTTPEMTARIGQAARAAASPGTGIELTQSPSGPASIECAHDEALAVPGVLARIRDGERLGVDAHVIACFGDPGLRAAREVAAAPVLGIAEAAMKAASMLASRFAIVTTLTRTVGSAEALVQQYGMTQHCRRVRATDIAVLDLDRADAALRRRILEQCRLALAQDGAEAIVLGCAGMADLCDELGAELGVPVIDGVAAAVRFAEALARAGLRTSKRGEYARPPPKDCSGVMAGFACHA